MDVKQTLMEFCSKTGVSGQETDAVRYACGQLSAYGAVETTPLGSVICRVQAPADGQAHLLLDAHIDEIGLIVTYIDPTGFLRVGACGGVDRRVLPAAKVTIHTAQGAVSGVVCSTPPHLSDGEETYKKVEEIYIDIGLTGEEAKQAVALGDRITLVAEPFALSADLVCSKALDDRAGCVTLLKVLDLLSNASLNCGLTVVFSSMEEVGGQGAKTAAYLVNPTHAIAVDVSFAHTPDAPREKCGDLGKGPMIGIAPILSQTMSRQLMDIAQKSGIPFQPEVMGGRTGTNADAIAVSHCGVVTGMVSVPLKYMHTPVEVVSVSDIEHSASLIADYVQSIGGDLSWN